jgi:exopolyphosphatase/guanosine-5'-triphosphate,3'-diphosphate pyrophosphatase
LEELQRLSLLVLGQRGKLRKIELHLDNEVFARQLLSLRLALILAHARREPNLTGLVLSDKPVLTLSLPPGWVERYPQSAHLLREEAMAWQKTDFPLSVLEC